MEIPFKEQIDSTGDCNTNQYRSDAGHCCSFCPPGSEVIQPCMPGNDTRCQPCVHRQTYSRLKPNLARTRICETCTICPPGAEILYACNITHDTVCRCQLDYYWDVKDTTCRHCDLCNVGFGALFPCEK